MTDVQRTTYGATRAALLRRLAEVAPQLRARTPDDPTVALLDGWALLAEILGFDAARAHDEGCLDLATDLRSVTELARLLDYRPDPGVAASTSLVFTLDDSVGAQPVVTVPAGTPVMRTPPPGGEPFVYETVEPLEGRPVWNRIAARLADPQVLTGSTTVVHLDGTGTNVLPGDGVLLPLAGGTAGFGLVTSVTVRPDDPPVGGRPGRRGWTTVTLSRLHDSRTWPGPPPGSPLFTDPVQGEPLAGLRTEGVTELDDAQLAERTAAGRLDAAALVEALRAARPAPGGVLVLRAQAGILGSGAPEWRSLPATLRQDLTDTAKAADGGSAMTLKSSTSPIFAPGSSTGVGPFATATLWLQDFTSPQYKWWADSNLANYPGADGPGNQERVFTDVVVRGLGPGVCVLRDGPTWAVRHAAEVSVASKTAYTVSGRSTVLTLDPPGAGQPPLKSFSIRGTTVHTNGEWLALAPEPLRSAVSAGTADTSIELDDWYDGLAAGRRVHVSGRSAATPGVVVHHVTRLRAVRHALDPGRGTIVQLVDRLPEDLVRDTVGINANVASATHGESRTQILATGDRRERMPEVQLAGAPLTYVTGPGGSLSTLSVFVDGVRRDEVRALTDADERGYVVRHRDDGTATVRFGSPLPPGVLNVRAAYRVGVGTGAVVGAGELDLLTRRPPGVRSVTNPLPAVGGADPESLEQARRNAPVSVRTLGRIVSLSDYGDYARAFPGVTKALAVRAGFGGTPGVLLTVAGEGGAVIGSTDPVREDLLRDLARLADPRPATGRPPQVPVPTEIAAHVPVPLVIRAGVRVDPRRVAVDVAAAAHEALVRAFAFDARELAQPVSLSEVIGVLQGVVGVRSGTVTHLARHDDPGDPGAPAGSPVRRRHIVARAARLPLGGPAVGAELLLLGSARVEVWDA